MTGQDTPRVSVVIVNYNGAALLDRCLASILQQSSRPMEIIVVDNGSTDESRSMLAARYPTVHLLAQEKNLGFAEGNNVGVTAARGDYVVLLNNDTEVTAGWMEGLVDMLRDPAVGVVTSRVETDGVPGEFYAMNGSLNPLGYNIMRVFEDLSLVFFAGGASLMFRRKEIPRPFLPEYFLYHEDVYLSWRLRLRGREVRMAQSSVVKHRGSASTKKHTSGLVTFYQERNRLLNALLLYEGITLLQLLPLFVLDAAAKVGRSLLLRRKSLWGILRAYGWCLAHPSWIATQRRAHQRERCTRDREVIRWMSGRLLDGSGAGARFVNAFAHGYTQLVGLRFYD
ncbi:MAG: glycosyltransferase family 2 protein [Bacteroidetes bacterium]|nr:glycosyltransferase family 2 protein [Bacteroidota bacterium]